MEYFIGKDGKGYFLIDEDDAEIVAASSSLAPVNDVMARLTQPLLQLKSIQDYLSQRGANAEQEARQDYERRLQDFRSRIRPLLSTHWERTPLRLEQVTQGQIEEAYNKKDDSFLLSVAYGLSQLI